MNEKIPLIENSLVGTAYYPEHWPEDRWDVDLALMREAGLNVVRVAEFAWVNLEPAEEDFHLEWLERFLTRACAREMHVILGTPTAIMPAWLARKYPESLATKPDGTRIVWGGRRHNCFSYPKFTELALRIVAKMAEHFAAHPAVIGWQIDNELGDRVGGTDCRCELCRAAFQAWLQVKYESLEVLNRSWGNHFWGLKIADWKEIPIPDRRTGPWAISNPSASLDWQRFTSQLSVDFLNSQAVILRKFCPASHFITHNLMGLASTVNYFELARQLDFVSWDNYPPLSPSIPYDSALAADLMRSVKKQNFMVMEQTAGPIGWEHFRRNLRPGELRKICYQQIAHGADAMMWFRWRTCTAGREQYWHGLLGHDGKPGRRYREAAQFAEEFQRISNSLSRTTVQTQVAILYDYDSLWALEIQGGYPDASHQEAIKRYYRALYRYGVNVDLVRVGEDLKDYRLVLAPHLHILSDQYATQLIEFVENGGVMLTDCRTAVKDETNLVHERRLPGLLAPMLGIEIDEYESMRLGICDDQEVTYTLRSGIRPENQFTAIKYADWITPNGAETVAEYTDWHMKSFAAVTRHNFGQGWGWYMGTIVAEEEFYDALIAKILIDADVHPMVANLPLGTEAVVRGNDDKKLLFLINHTDEVQTIPVPDGKTELLTSKRTSDRLSLDKFGVAVIDFS